MSNQLNERVYLLYGANGGIGSAVARRLAGRGAQLMLAGRNATAIKALASELGAEIGVVDAADTAGMAQLVEATRDRFGRLDGVMNAFGTMLLKPAHLTTDEEWTETLAVNLTSAFAITRVVARHFPKEGGSVVFLSSAVARTGMPNHEAIAAAKAGLIGLALSAAATYAPKRIRFNVVAPGLTRTPLAAKITSNDAALNASIRMHPLGRIGEADDVASAVEWFLDPAQSWVTGQVLGVDGGLGSLRGRAGV